MRAAVLQFVFEELGAEIARSGAFVDNEASLAVSRSFGYRENGFARAAPRGTPRTTVNLELTRDEWAARRHSFAVAEVSGLDACRSMFTELP
jgi:RimJ/RimL family protein N-acetyltransferase